jgi:iron complex transport system substrate-binding protein
MRDLRFPLRKLSAVPLIALLVLASVPALSAVGSESFSVVDDAGRQVTLPHVPQRIVSIAPGATEMLFAAGAGSRVIATVEYSDEPPEAKKIPRIGDSNAIDMERVVALRPDVVVVWDGGNNVAQIARLEALKVPLYRHKVEKLGDIPVSLRRLGALTGTRAAAEASARDVETRLARLEERYGRAPDKPTVLLEVWNRPVYTVGGAQMMSDSLRLCGARNVFGDLTQPGPSVDVEAVIRRDPQIIVAVAPPGVSQDWLAEWKRFGSLRAVRDHRLVPFEDQRLSRLGPSAVGGTEALCEAIHRR